MNDMHEKRAMFLRVHVGTAKGEDGAEYTMSTSISGSPLIQSKKTGRTFDIGWQGLLNLAIEAGVDNEPETVLS